MKNFTKTKKAVETMVPMTPSREGFRKGFKTGVKVSIAVMAIGALTTGGVIKYISREFKNS